MLRVDEFQQKMDEEEVPLRVQKIMLKIYKNIDKGDLK